MVERVPRKFIYPSAYDGPGCFDRLFKYLCYLTSNLISCFDSGDCLSKILHNLSAGLDNLSCFLGSLPGHL